MNKNILNKQKIILNDIRKKLYISVIPMSIAILILSGCSNNNNNEKVTTENKNIIKEEINTIKEETTTEDTTQKTTTEVSTFSEESTTETVTENIDKDSIVLKEFDKYKNEVYESNDKNTFSKKGKEFFIKTVDFIFYNGQIKGVTFNELKDSTKEAIYNGLCDMDELIMEIAPNYKENIADKYEIVKDFTKKAYYSSLDKIKELIGEERYDKVKELKDSLKEKAGDVVEKAGEKVKEYKNKLKDWYQNYKEN